MRTAPKFQDGRNAPGKKHAGDNLKSPLTGGNRGKRVAAGDVLREDASTGSFAKGITNEEKRQLIAEAAYFRSEKRSFIPGYELEDWLEAEAEIEKTH